MRASCAFTRAACRLSDDVDLALLARGTPGFAGADLENLVNEAALLAARRNKDRVDMADFEVAKDKVMMGAERKSMIMSQEETPQHGVPRSRVMRWWRSCCRVPTRCTR